MSGTPVIATNWGVFPETVIHGLTGWRCRTLEEFEWAAQNVAWGRVYRSLDSVVTDRIGFISTYGLYSYASTQTLDFPVVQAEAFVIAVLVFLINALVDLSFRYLDPRLRNKEA